MPPETDFLPIIRERIRSLLVAQDEDSEAHNYPLTSEARFSKLAEPAAAADLLRAPSERAFLYTDKKDWLA